MTYLERLYKIKKKFVLKNIQANKNKKSSKANFKNSLQNQNIKYKYNNISVEWNSEKRFSEIS